MQNKTYDVIIIGTGPAGYTAAIYSARYNLNTLLIGKEIGGMATTAYKVENWPGTKSISGLDLMAKFKEHAESFKQVKLEIAEINNIKKNNDFFEVKSDENIYQAKTIILALGSTRRKLNIPGEKEFTGKGVAYCATCDAMFFKDKKVAVVGGGNSAVQAALLLAEYANKINLLYRGQKLKADPIWINRAEKNKKIEINCCVNVIKAEGKDVLEKIILNNNKELEVSGLFIEIGAEAPTDITKKLGLKLNQKNLIIIDSGGKTNLQGIFAAGDITTGSNSLRQIITSASEGAIAATSAYQYLKNH